MTTVELCSGGRAAGNCWVLWELRSSCSCVSLPSLHEDLALSASKRLKMLLSVTIQRSRTQQSHFFCSVSTTSCSLDQVHSEKGCFVLSGMHLLCSSKSPPQVGMIFSEKWHVSFTLNQMHEAGVHSTQHYCKLDRKPTFIS